MWTFQLAEALPDHQPKSTVSTIFLRVWLYQQYKKIFNRTLTSTKSIEILYQAY